MNARILLFVSALAGLTSCATYRSGQTPDDVYYSPARETEQYVEVQRNDDRYSYNENRLEEERMRQQIRDPRFRSFEDDFYWNSPYNNRWNTFNNWNNPWNTWGWNNNYWGSWNNWNSWNTWGNSFYCIPGTNFVITKPGTGVKTSTGIRYSPSVQSFTNARNTTSSGSGGGKGIFTNGSGNSGSRYFGGAVNNSNNNRRTSSGLFSGSSSSGSSNRIFSGGSSSGSSSGGGSRTFSSGGSSSSGSSSGSKSSGNTGGRRN
jgi:hypothetical protein